MIYDLDSMVFLEENKIHTACPLYNDGAVVVCFVSLFSSWMTRVNPQPMIYTPFIIDE